MNKDTIKSRIDTIEKHSAHNTLVERYYEGQTRLKDLRIGIPPSLSTIGTVVGWAEICIDSATDRIRLVDITTPDADANTAINELMERGLQNTVRALIQDSVIYGVGFSSVSVGDPELNEPPVIVCPESPFTTTASWSQRSQVVTDAIKVDKDKHGITGGSLITPQVDYHFDSNLEIIEEEEHGDGFVSVVRLVNNYRSRRMWGKSDITRPIRYSIDAAVRTLVGSEVSREFFNSPQRYILGASEDMFTDEDGNPIPAWESYIGNWLAVDRDDEGNLPQVGTFSSSSPAPYIDQVGMFSKIAASQARLPVSYLGLVDQSIPSSADAIRLEESPLLRRIEAKMPSIEQSVRELVRYALASYGFSEWRTIPINIRFASLATETPAATADQLSKMIAADAIPAHSDYVLKKLEITPQDMAEIKLTRAQAANQSILNSILAAPVSEEANNASKITKPDVIATGVDENES